MSWHLLPPQVPEDCRFRRQDQSEAGGEWARCGLVCAALSEADASCCRVSRSTCQACCQLDPATPTTWNPVVGSLVYHAASAVLKRPDTPREEIARAETARAKALACLDVTPRRSEAQPQSVAPFNTLGELIPSPPTRHPEPIRKWAVAVTTAPRRRPVLDACLGNLTRAGWESPHLFMDSAVRVAQRYGHLPGTLRSPAAGAWPNHYLALLELSLRHPDADAFLIVQDDALIYDGENVRAYLQQALWPGGRHLPIVSLYCPQPYTTQHYGWHLYPKNWVWGAVALIFPRSVLQAYLRDRAICEHRWRSSSGGLKQIDVLIGWWARRRRIPFWFPTPSLVQHIGQTSTLWTDCPADGPRAASLFVGTRPTASADEDQ